MTTEGVNLGPLHILLDHSTLQDISDLFFQGSDGHLVSRSQPDVMGSFENIIFVTTATLVPTRTDTADLEELEWSILCCHFGLSLRLRHDNLSLARTRGICESIITSIDQVPWIQFMSEASQPLY